MGMLEDLKDFQEFKKFRAQLKAEEGETTEETTEDQEEESAEGQEEEGTKVEATESTSKAPEWFLEYQKTQEARIKKLETRRAAPPKIPAKSAPVDFETKVNKMSNEDILKNWKEGGLKNEFREYAGTQGAS